MKNRFMILILLVFLLPSIGCVANSQFSKVGYLPDTRSDIVVSLPSDAKVSSFQAQDSEAEQVIQSFDLNSHTYRVIGNFDYNKSELTQNMLAEVQSEIIEKDRKIDFVIATADADGSFAYNKKLSRQRSESAKNFLLKHGFATDGIKFMGAGETEAFGSHRDLNRCLIFVFQIGRAHV